MNYSEIKKNVIERFLVPLYKFTMIRQKRIAIKNIEERFPFKIDYDYETDIMKIYLGDDINIDITFEWEEKENNGHKVYRLTSFK